MAISAVYLDSSALVKLAVQEPESDALRAYLRRRKHTWVTSALAKTEVLRALIGAGDDAVASGRGVLARCELVRVNDRVLNAAATLLPAEVRSLDAIHLATALSLGDAGWALGGTVGVGTVLFAATVGPNVQFWLDRLDLGFPEGFEPTLDPVVEPDPTIAGG